VNPDAKVGLFAITTIKELAGIIGQSPRFAEMAGP
jgi:hypothetical protein